MKTFYVTTAANMPRGCGYWEIGAETEAEARRIAFAHCPEGRWSFMYSSVDEIHEMDRKCHGRLGAWEWGDQ